MNKNIQTLKSKINTGSSNLKFLSIKGGNRIVGDIDVDFGVNADLCQNTKDCTESSNKRICNNLNICRTL